MKPPFFFIFFISMLSCCLTFNVDLNTSYVVLFGDRRDKPGNLFGYSIALYTLKRNVGVDESLLVGAPLSSVNADYTGELYRCSPLTHLKGTAKECIPEDLQLVPATGEVREKQWLGGAISVYNYNYVVCAPRWTKIADSGVGRFWGKCFVYQRDQKKLVIPCKEQAGYQYCQAGLAVHMLDGDRVIYGTPGGRNARGALMVKNWDDTSSDSATPEDGLADSFYLGYSIAVGNFNGGPEKEIAGGIPRSQITGKVFIYSNDARSHLASIYPPTKVSAKKEYIGFGASVCAVDLTGDGFDDVIVGAPFYSDKGDEGRVYVYINQAVKNSDIPTFKLSSREDDSDPGLRGSNQQGARFGTAIVAAGDLNNDNYDDFVVGAPLDGEDGNGAIYVYHGAKDGIDEDYQQKITASEMAKVTSHPLRQFGYSLSANRDTDSNGYPDIAVGAWGSERVVLLRTRPVMDVTPSLILSIKQIPVENITNKCPNTTNVQCLNAMACFLYGGKSVPPDQTLRVVLQLDPESTFKRVYLLVGNQKTYEMTQDVTLPNRSVKMCANFRDIHVEHRDDLILSQDYDINFLVRYSLVTKPKCKSELCPVLARKPEPLISEKATLIFNCTGNSCDYDLTIEITSKQGSIIIGGLVETLTAEVTLSNTGEKSYNPEITVLHDASLQYEKKIKIEGKNKVEKRAVTTGNESTTELFRVLGAIDNGEQVKFQLQYSTRKIDGTTPTVFIKVSARGTSGKEGNDKDNNGSLVVVVERDVKLDLVGKSVPTALSYPELKGTFDIKNMSSGSEMNITDLLPAFQITFFLTNKGKSPLPSKDLALKINYPYRESDNDNEQSYIIYPLSVSPASCNATVLDPENLSFDKAAGRKKREVTLSTRTKQSQTINCKVNELLSGERFEVKFNSRLWLPTLAKLYPKDIALIINAEATFKDKLKKVEKKTTEKAEVTINLTPKNVAGEPKGTPIWVIIVSVLGGILLLALLLFALFKCGFFKRNRPPKDISDPQVDDQEPVQS